MRKECIIPWCSPAARCCPSCRARAAACPSGWQRASGLPRCRSCQSHQATGPAALQYSVGRGERKKETVMGFLSECRSNSVFLRLCPEPVLANDPVRRLYESPKLRLGGGCSPTCPEPVLSKHALRKQKTAPKENRRWFYPPTLVALAPVVLVPAPAK